MTRTLALTGVAPADELLARDPFALLVGMLLDQQFPMERAFLGAYLLAERLGDPTRLDPCAVAQVPDDELHAAAAGPPAIHRYPRAMADRIKVLAELVCAEHGGDAARLWESVPDAASCRRALQALPGFGDKKSRIFVALLGKQWGSRPDGWREASAPYGDPGVFMSVADVVDRESLDRVRAFKKEQKSAARG